MFQIKINQTVISEIKSITINASLLLIKLAIKNSTIINNNSPLIVPKILFLFNAKFCRVLFAVNETKI